MTRHSTNILVHLWWSTRDRLPLIEEALERPLHDCVARRCRALGCVALATGGVEDHLHVLVLVHPSVAVADLVRDIKACSSGMIRRVFERRGFAWQSGYGAISLRRSEIDAVREHIRRQRAHHARASARIEGEADESTHDRGR